MSKRRVVVTGMGAVTPYGVGVKTFWDSIVAGKSGISLSEGLAEGHTVLISGQVKDFNPEDYINPKDAKRMDRYTQFAMVAADEAIADAKLEGVDVDPYKIGVIVSSAAGGFRTLEKSHKSILDRGPTKCSPFTIPMMIADMASGRISMKYGFKGINKAVLSACATGTHSIGDAFRAIQYGDADIVVAGGCEATICDIGIGAFTAAKTLSKRNDEPEKASRPYDKDRDGFIMSEGAGVLVLEEYETVQMLLAKDTRIAPGEPRLYLFGGLLSCGDCGGNLIRRTNSYKGEKTVFYICSSYNKKKDQCSRHSIREDVLIQLVMDSLKMYSKMTDAIRSAVEYLKENSLDTQTLIQHDDQILELRNKVNKYYKLLHSLSGNLASGVISKDDYALIRERYQTEIKSLESNIEKQEEYMEDLLENKLLCEEWVNTFLEKPSLGDLDRDMLLQYVEKINVFEGKKIEIVYRFQDELVTAARLAEQIGKTKQEVAV